MQINGGQIKTLLPKDGEVTEEEFHQFRSAYYETLNSLEEKLSGNKALSDSYFDKHFLAKVPGSKLIFFRDEKGKVNIEYYMKEGKPLPALPGAIQFGHVRFLRSLLQDPDIKKQLEENIHLYLISALQNRKMGMATELLKYHPLQDDNSIFELLINAILQQNFQFCRTIIDEKKCSVDVIIRVKKEINSRTDLNPEQRDFISSIDKSYVEKFLSAYTAKRGRFFNPFSPMASRIRNKETRPLQIEDIVQMASNKNTRTAQVCNEIGFAK